jgi:hypothetical protein
MMDDLGRQILRLGAALLALALFWYAFDRLGPFGEIGNLIYGSVAAGVTIVIAGTDNLIGHGGHHHRH